MSPPTTAVSLMTGKMSCRRLQESHLADLCLQTDITKGAINLRKVLRVLEQQSPNLDTEMEKLLRVTNETNDGLKKKIYTW